MSENRENRLHFLLWAHQEWFLYHGSGNKPSFQSHSEISNSENLQTGPSQKQKPKSIANSEDPGCDDLLHIDGEKLVEQYGTYGRYQLYNYFVVQMLNFFYSASLYIMSFVQLKLNMECTDLDTNTTIPLYHEGCNMVTEGTNLTDFHDKICGEYKNTKLKILNADATTNLLVDYNLECTHYLFQEGGLTMFSIGAVVTVPLMSYLADRYGRKPVIVWNGLAAFIFNLAAAFSPNYYIFLVLRFFVGATSDTYLSIANIVTCEYITEKARSWITVVYNIAWALGMLWVGFVTLMTKNWRWIYFIGSMPGIYIFYLWWVLPESPHWMSHHNKTKGLKTYIKKSNKFNSKKADLNKCQNYEIEEKKHESLMDILRSKHMIFIIVANGILEFVLSIVYYGINFESVDMSDDNFTAFMISSFLEIPGGLLVIPLMLYFGRRIINLTSFVGQGIALIATCFITDHTLNFIVVMIAKTLATILYSVHPIWGAEQFPTTVRSLSFSIVNVPQSAGILLAPYYKHVKIDGYEWVPNVGLAVISFLSALLCCFMVETKDKLMPVDIRSLKNYKSTMFSKNEKSKEQVTSMESQSTKSTLLSEKSTSEKKSSEQSVSKSDEK